MARNEKPMTMEQFRAELETDATKRNAEQEKTIKRLIRENKELNEFSCSLMNAFQACYNKKSVGLACLVCPARKACRTVIRLSANNPHI